MSLMRSAVLSLCATAVFSASALAQNTWQPYQFNGTEKFAYDITYTQAGQLEEGQLTLDFAQEDGRTWLTIDGAVGDMSCSGRSPMDNAQAAQQALMMQCFHGADSGRGLHAGVGHVHGSELGAGQPVEHGVRRPGGEFRSDGHMCVCRRRGLARRDRHAG